VLDIEMLLWRGLVLLDYLERSKLQACLLLLFVVYFCHRSAREALSGCNGDVVWALHCIA
jgi:hypothetical protein